MALLTLACASIPHFFQQVLLLKLNMITNKLKTLVLSKVTLSAKDGLINV
jgi:hypothetical protein